jgi:hypothetical protein
LASTAEQIQIPALSCAHGIILTGIELPSGEVGEVTLQMKDVSTIGAVKGISTPFSARVLCEAKVIANTDRITLVAKKVVYAFPSGYIAETPMAGYVISTEDGNKALPAQKNNNVEQVMAQSALTGNVSAAYIQDLIKDIKPTVVLQSGRLVDLMFTEQLVIEDKPKAN